MTEPNQNPPSERGWTIAEREEFFASQDAMTGLFNGAVASNALVGEVLAPLTLADLQQAKIKFDILFSEPLKFLHGADMSPETLNALGINLYTTDGGRTFIDPHIAPVIGVEVHLVPGMPFGKVEECSCEERRKVADGTR
jgi:hypothetical protein